MRHRSILADRDGVLDVAMTPMIDVVFMLLIFFVWTASFRVAELVLPSSLITPSQGQGNAPRDPELEDLDRIVVRITWNGSLPAWAVNDVSAVTLAEVRQRLISAGRVKASLPVLVDPVPDVPLGHVMDIFDIARVAGFENVQFATEAN
jgi:biopolymer transport protein ExbD